MSRKKVYKNTKKTNPKRFWFFGVKHTLIVFHNLFEMCLLFKYEQTLGPEILLKFHSGKELLAFSSHSFVIAS